jgi:hypothetical protein
MDKTSSEQTIFDTPWQGARQMSFSRNREKLHLLDLLGLLWAEK